MPAVPRHLRVIFLILVIISCLGLAGRPAAASPAGSEHLPNLQTIIPTNAFSIVTTPEGPEFRYTHLVYNDGPGPLEIQPSYDNSVGGYRGSQMIFSHSESGSWSQVRTRPIPDMFVFHAEHGHFHFPLASFGLYAVAADGGFGAPVALSPKVGFCIDDSYLYNADLEHSGAFVGSRTSCTDPNGLRGISVGGADEYDYRDPGQAVPIGGVPDGTYWFRAMTDPNDDIAELDESDNETDVKVTIANGVVTPGTVIHPDTTPPAGTIAAPRDGQVVTGTVPLTVTTSTPGVRRIDFVADGTVIGSVTGTSPYTFSWRSPSVVDGEHWLSARIFDSSDRVGNTGVSAVSVSNVTPPPNTGALTLKRSVSRDGRDTQTAPVLTGLSGGELLLAMVSADGPGGEAQSASVSGGGLTWVPVRRANARPGSSEVWKAVVPAQPTDIAVTSSLAAGGYDQSLTVLAFGGAAGVGGSAAAGAANGPSRVTLTTTRPGSWVFGAGNDWDVAATRTAGADQQIRHQWVDSAVGDTFWMQSRARQTPAAGTTVTIDDTAPTTGRWNLAAVEVLASAYTPPAPDRTPPTARVTDPTANAKLKGVITIGVTAADNVGVTAVRFTIDGTLLATDTRPPFAATWTTTGVKNGKHTIAAEAVDAAGNVGRSPAVSVTVDNSGPPPATIILDAKVVRHGTGTLTSPALTTKTANDQLLAFVALDGPESAAQSATVSGAGVNWTLVKRSNTQRGGVDIWAARAKGIVSGKVVTATPARPGYAGALTVLAFRNAQGLGVAGASGAPSGRPSIYLPAVSAASWVFAVGNDWDRAVARQPVAGQVLHQQWVAQPPGDTFWVQSTTAPSAMPGLVTITDTQPTTDRWNLAAVEIKAVGG